MQLSLDKLKGGKNLLAFSGGVDSTALFFILMENQIDFDIAIVDYNIREQSKDEIAYAKELVRKYKKEIYIKSVNLDLSNFEAKAREVRYKFFEEIIKEKGYQNLITAHQLDDRIEWFFMQMSKGAGLVELMGLCKVNKKDFYTIHRPLLNITKKELLGYLKKREIKYFIDESNRDERYKRNYFRKYFTKRFLEEYSAGIKKSFEYLEKDYKELLKIEIIYNEDDFYLLKNQKNDLKNIRAIDKILKKLGVILSSKTKEEILDKRECVVSHKIAVAITDEYIYIAPYVKNILSKKEKEFFRIHKIPKIIRFYLSEKKIFSFDKN